MLTTEDYLNSLKNDKKKLVENLNTKGVIATDKETFTELAPKVLEIKTGTEPSGTIDISENGIVDVTPYASANVNVSSGGGDFFTNNSYQQTGFQLRYAIKTLPILDISTTKYMNNAFSECVNLEKIPALDFTSITEARYMCSNCGNLKEVEIKNLVNVKDAQYMFDRCEKLVKVLNFDMPKVTNMSSCFKSNILLPKAPEINMPLVEDVSYMFGGCKGIEYIPEYEGSNIKNLDGVYGSAWVRPNKLTFVGGFKNLGKAFETAKSENFSQYKLDLSFIANLTKESLLNVINNLYDIKSIGVKPQTLSLGATNIAKLTPEEIAIATNKGWNIS